ncbi:hypothetical protein [Streptomyces chattanoogensis]|uniref:hypothetical protein n=1 Tax=Streptomyces chattanoogensis TaxID=66876 RepID=UPI00368968FF
MPRKKIGRKFKGTRANSGPSTAPLEPIKPYIYGASASNSRPEIPEDEPVGHPAPRLTPPAMPAHQEQREERLTERVARRGLKVKMMLLKPVRRYTDEPTLKDKLEYIREVAGDMLLDLERAGSVDESEAENLMRAAESMWVLATGVEVVEEEVEIA